MRVFLKITIDVFFLYILLSVPSLAIAEDDFNYHTASICEKSAVKMFHSCRNEIKEEFAATNAKCINQVGADIPVASVCKRMARSTIREDRKGCRDQREARMDVCE